MSINRPDITTNTLRKGEIFRLILRIFKYSSINSRDKNNRFAAWPFIILSKELSNYPWNLRPLDVQRENWPKTDLRIDFIKAYKSFSLIDPWSTIDSHNWPYKYFSYFLLFFGFDLPMLHADAEPARVVSCKHILMTSSSDVKLSNVAPGVYLGDIYQAQNLDLLNSFNITHVLPVGSNLYPYFPSVCTTLINIKY